METCKVCLYLVVIGDPKMDVNECHRFPPGPPDNKGLSYLSYYPQVKNNTPGCGERLTAEELAEQEKELVSVSMAGQTRVKERIDKARGNRLKR